MKVAVLGTVQSGCRGEEAALLRYAGLTVLQRMAGYVAPTMATASPLFQPIIAEYAICADAMMTRLCHQEIVGANPRAPYLMVSWLLLGADNPFCIRRYAHDDTLVLHLARLLLRIACGDEPSPSERQLVTRTASMFKVSALEQYNRGWRNASTEEGQSYARTRTDAVATAILRAAGAVNANMLHPAWVAWSVGAIVNELVRFEGNHIEATVWKQARAWCYISDDVAGRIVRKLFFDMLDR
jgi:hypothetical protein